MLLEDSLLAMYINAVDGTEHNCQTHILENITSNLTEVKLESTKLFLSLKSEALVPTGRQKLGLSGMGLSLKKDSVIIRLAQIFGAVQKLDPRIL